MWGGGGVSVIVRGSFCARKRELTEIASYQPLLFFFFSFLYNYAVAYPSSFSLIFFLLFFFFFFFLLFRFVRIDSLNLRGAKTDSGT